jgi:hypothetical protein
MSRIRSIHPGLWTDEAFVSLSSFARLLFMGLWNECDDKGMFPWSPLQMKMRILPADNVDAAALLAELEAAGCIRPYEVGGKRFGAVRNFVKFQRPKSPNDIYPAPPEILVFAGHEVEVPASGSEKLPEHSPEASEISPQREEGEEEEGREEDEPNGSCASGDALRPDHVFDEWNQVAGRIGKPRIRDATPARRATVRNRIAQYEITDFVNVFGKVERSPFLRGDTGWPGCNFDWVMKRANFQKILEGNYDQ